MTATPETLRAILDQARWAPSGDNTQPWRFEILGEEHVRVHGFDTRDHVVYDLDGHASQLALGALLETLSIAASAHGRSAAITRHPDTPETRLLFDVHLRHDSVVMPDPLADCIERRVVQRRPMSTRPLTGVQKAALEACLPAGYRVIWFESLARRWQIARFMFANAKVRLLMPEGFAVHRAVIEWNARYSADKIPDQAVGVDPLTARLMRWALASWPRMHFLNTYLLGHLGPRIQLDLVPGVLCAAQLALLAPQPLQHIDDYVAAGRALQRFWLTATQQGLLMQPEMTPVIFTRYHRQGRRFTHLDAAARRVARLNRTLADLLTGKALDSLFFMGRIGTGPLPWARSTRKPLEALGVLASGHNRAASSRNP